MNYRQSSKEAEEPDLSYFGLQAHWGATKHFGGVKATRELAELRHVGEGKHVLDVGCGVGRTSSHLAKECGCRVTGIDISEKMVGKAESKAREVRLVLPAEKGVEEKR